MKISRINGLAIIKKCDEFSCSFIFVMCLFFSSVVMSETPNSLSPSGAKVYFVSPKQGSVFDRSEGSEIEVVFGIKGMQVAPQETEVESYVIGGIKQDIKENAFSGFKL